MLVLSRRVGEEIVIGNNVRVRIVAADGTKVRLAIAAPKFVRVDRLEVSRRRAEFACDTGPQRAAPDALTNLVTVPQPVTGPVEPPIRA